MYYYNVCVMSIVAVGDMTVYSRSYNVHYVTVPLVVCTNIKSHDHPQHWLRPDIFSKEQYSILIGKQRAFVDKLSAKTKNTLKVSNTVRVTLNIVLFSTTYLSIHHPSIYLYLYLSIYLSIDT